MGNKSKKVETPAQREARLAARRQQAKEDREHEARAVLRQFLAEEAADEIEEEAQALVTARDEAQAELARARAREVPYREGETEEQRDERVALRHARQRAEAALEAAEKAIEEAKAAKARDELEAAAAVKAAEVAAGRRAFLSRLASAEKYAAEAVRAAASVGDATVIAHETWQSASKATRENIVLGWRGAAMDATKAAGLVAKARCISFQARDAVKRHGFEGDAELVDALVALDRLVGAASISVEDAQRVVAAITAAKELLR